MKKKLPIHKRAYRAFWELLRKIGVWDWCPNCDSLWQGGSWADPRSVTSCIVCGQDKKENRPNEWVWGWVVPRFIQSRIMARRIRKENEENKHGKEKEKQG